MSALFSISSISTILSSVIVVSVQRVQVRNSNLSRRPAVTTLIGGPTLWISGLPAPDSARSLRQATYPQLLHHVRGCGQPALLRSNAYPAINHQPSTINHQNRRRMFA
jgi:hypothetical protein